MKGYLQLTSKDRHLLAHLKQRGHSQAEIARQMNRSASTISRELVRNKTRFDGHYRPVKAQEYTNGRRSRARRNEQFTASDYLLVRKLLKAFWSPEQISDYLGRNRLRKMSHETIYRYIWYNKHAHGDPLHKYLRQGSKRRRKRYRSYDSRGILGTKRMIYARPASVESRAIKGHWEIDTVTGARGTTACIVTLLERKTGYVLIGKLKDRSMRSLNKRVLSLMQRHAGKFKTITADNGTEFHAYKKIEEQTGVKFYFARPYHSWERGSNENVNGLIRQYLPKGKSMVHLSQRQCDLIAEKLNTRPRKRHNYRTPKEGFIGKCRTPYSHFPARPSEPA